MENLNKRPRETAEEKRKSGTVRLGPLNIPVRLIQAIRENRLVIFAGAGVSMASPSNLPDFLDLSKQIADEVLTLKDGEPLDLFLGRLAQQAGIPVHQKAAKILEKHLLNSQPSDLHRILVGLFSNPASLRIVTTNFDRHFESVLSERWPNLEIYSAPALPIGNRFSGLAYVHGQLDRDPQRLVLTDSDFGRAYLTEGWARRFLEEVFATYDVLFVGYRHEDVVLRYLARGLPPTQERIRFAFTSSGDPERWQFVGITPIQYDPTNQHAALSEGLKAWLDLENRGPLGHERKIQELVARSPQALTEQEEDYRLFCTHDSRLAQFFYRHATRAEWLTWANERSLLSHLFDLNNESSASSMAAFWLTKEALSERGDVARELVYRAHHLSPQLWNAIARAVWRGLDANEISAKAAERAAQWLSILECHDEAALDRRIIDYWLKHLSAEEHTFLAVQLFEYLLRPIAVPEMRPTYGENGSLAHILIVSVKVRGDKRLLSTEWERLFKPNLRTFAPLLAPIVLGHLQHAHLLIQSHRIGSKRYDPMSADRFAIEPHERNRYGGNEAFDLIIDAGRDIIDWFLENEPRIAMQVIEVGLLIDTPLVQRLCIYGFARHPQIDANAKVNRVITEKWLEQPQLKHDIFSVFHEAYKDIKPSVRKRLIREAERFYLFQGEQVFDDPVKEEATRTWDLFKLLSFLQEADPSCPLLSARIMKIKQRHPEFEVPDYSDRPSGPRILHYISPVSKYDMLMLSPSEWIKSFELASAQKNDLHYFFYRAGHGLLAETAKAAAEDFEWGLKLAQYLATEGYWDHPAWPYLLQCWAKQSLTDPQWNSLLTLLLECPAISRYASSDIVDMLLRRIENRDVPATEKVIEDSVALIGELWPTFPEEQVGEDFNDWDQATQKTGSKLVLFLVCSLSRLRTIRNERNGIPESISALLELMVQGVSEFGRVTLCGQLGFMFAIDRLWTAQNLFPLFDWSYSTKLAAQAWQGFLILGQPTLDLVSAVMPMVEMTFDYLGELGNSRKHFPALLASIGCSSTSDPLESGWIKKFLRKARPEDRIEWARNIGLILNESDQEERGRIWNSWLHKYFIFRLDLGLPFDDDEWREMIKWSTSLEEFLPEFVGLLVRGPSVRVRDTLLYYQLREQQGLLRHPNSFADLILYLLGPEEVSFYDSEFVAEIFPRLQKAGASRTKLHRIAERLAELGCSNAQELAALIDDNS